MINRDSFYRLYWKIQSVIAPKLVTSQLIYENIIKEYHDKNNKWLDLGCGHQLLPEWREDQEKELIGDSKMIVGVDYDLYSLKIHRSIKDRIRGDISVLPFKDNSFNIITSNMVFEHLSDPFNQLTEIKRILTPGGILIFHTPNIYGYGTILARLIPDFIKNNIVNFLQDRKDEDIFKTYFRINSEKDICRNSESVGLEVKKVKFLTTSAQFVMIPPLVIFELIWIRLLMTKALKLFRTNLIAILIKK